jgi:hypothetical protein
VVVAVVTALIGWLLSSRDPDAQVRQGDEYVLGYSGQWRLVARLSFAGPPFMGYMLLRETPGGDVATFVLIGLFIAAAAFLNLEMRRQVRVSVRGVRMIPPLGKPVSIAWRNVSELKWRSTKREFELHAEDGRVIRVSQNLSGLSTLGEHIARHLPHVHDAADANVLLNSL